MKKIFLVTFIFVLLIFAISGNAAEKRLLLGTSSVGGTYYVLGAGWSNLMNQNVPGVNISVQSGGGPATNVQLIQQGEMDFGLTTGWLGGDGYRGEGWAKGKKYDEIRTIFPMYFSSLHIYTLDKSPIKDIYDFEGKHISVGSAGSTSDAAGRALLKTLGIKPREISSLPLGASTNGLKDGTIEACFVVTGVPGPFMLDLESSHKIRFIKLSQEDYEKVFEAFPFWSRGVMKAGAYKGIKEDLPVVNFWNFAIADKDLPDDLIYKIVKATFENRQALITINPKSKATIPENIIYSTIPIHSGALKYYKEVGIEIPDELIPPEAR